MRNNSKSKRSDPSASFSPAEVAQVRNVMRQMRAPLASDRRTVAESWQSVEESKKRLAIKPQKL